MREPFRIAVLPGDGVGPEVIAPALRILDRLLSEGCRIEWAQAAIGAAAVRSAGIALPESTWTLARDAHAVLVGAVGDPVLDDDPEPSRRPGWALLELRRRLGLFANLRPVRPDPELVGVSTLRPHVLQGVDLLIVRELAGDVYYGTPRGRRRVGDRYEAFDTMCYGSLEVDRLMRVAFRLARQRRCRLCSVDKANVLETSRLWRERAVCMGGEHPDVQLGHQYVDNCAMQLVRRPAQFDVIATGNLFGDILSDAAAMLAGSIGMLPSASIGDTGGGLFEPVHGSAPDIAGHNTANPIATIRSLALLFRHALGDEGTAMRIERAVQCVLADGARCADIAGPGDRPWGTERMGEAVLAAM